MFGPQKLDDIFGTKCKANAMKFLESLATNLSNTYLYVRWAENEKHNLK